MITTLVANADTLLSELITNPLPVVVALIAAAVAIYSRVPSVSKDVPFINPNKRKTEFMQDGAKLLREWFKTKPNRPVRVHSEVGDLLVLPANMTNEIRNDPRLEFAESTEEDFHAHLPGFEPFKFVENQHIVLQMVRKDLTQHLSKITRPLAEETSLALRDLLSDAIEWHEASVNETCLNLIARLSSRVFLGEELCRDKHWLSIAKEYTVVSFNAARELRLWTPILRPIAVRFLDSCRQCQAMVAEACRIIRPVAAQRNKARNAAAAQGIKYSETNDALDWLAAADKENRFDAGYIQLSLSFAAIHTTSDLLSETLLRIAKQPCIVSALREEICQVLKSDGWHKTALYKMKLLDSVLKETQRMKPITLVTMNRLVKENFVLSDGTALTKGEKICVTSTNLQDPSNHENPDEWDPYRFVRMREDPSKQNLAHMVSTSGDHNAFGHGQHACPGRFFATNEIKIALLVILLKYDIGLCANQTSKVYEFGYSLASDPFAKLRFRRRESEIDLDNLTDS